MLSGDNTAWAAVPQPNYNSKERASSRAALLRALLLAGTPGYLVIVKYIHDLS